MKAIQVAILAGVILLLASSFLEHLRATRLEYRLDKIEDLARLSDCGTAVQRRK